MPLIKVRYLTYQAEQKYEVFFNKLFFNEILALKTIVNT